MFDVLELDQCYSETIVDKSVLGIMGYIYFAVSLNSCLGEAGQPDGAHRALYSLSWD